ncbi:MAG: hypothetical protein RR910_08390 [Acidaminococcaceae bacterium]
MDKENLKKIMTIDYGRRFIFELVQASGTDYLGTFDSPVSQAFNAGRRSVGNDILLTLRDIGSEDGTDEGLTLEHIMRKEAAARNRQSNNDDNFLSY